MNHYKFFSKIYEFGAKRMCQDCENFIKRGSKILDLGCGSGIAAYHFQKFFQAEIIGADIKDNRLVPIPFKIFNGKNLSFTDNSFDIVLLNYVLHHCQDPERLLKEAKRVSKRIIIFEDLPEGIFSKLRCTFHQTSYNIFQKEKQKFNFKTKKEWQELFKKIGLKIIAEKRVIISKLDFFDPVYRILFVLEKGV